LGARAKRKIRMVDGKIVGDQLEADSPTVIEVG
jgi:hypothetical protein